MDKQQVVEKIRKLVKQHELLKEDIFPETLKLPENEFKILCLVDSMFVAVSSDLADDCRNPIGICISEDKALLFSSRRQTWNNGQEYAKGFQTFYKKTCNLPSVEESHFIFMNSEGKINLILEKFNKKPLDQYDIWWCLDCQSYSGYAYATNVEKRSPRARRKDEVYETRIIINYV